MFAEAFSYPLRGSGRILLIIGAILSALLDFATKVPFIGFAAWILGGAYFVAYYFDIIVTTVSGRDEPPDFPEITDLYGDIIAPLIRSLGSLILAFLPFVVCTIMYRSEGGAPTALRWACLGFAAVYYPMAILNVAVSDEMAGALPHRVLPDIVRAMPKYLILVLLLLLVMIFSELSVMLRARIPVVGGVVGAGFSLYCVMVQARMAGMFYQESAGDDDDTVDATDRAEEQANEPQA